MTPPPPSNPDERSRAISGVLRRLDPRRWALAGLGVACVGLGIAGVFVPGLPTTIFLIAAAWCFARSCPALERRLIHENRLLAPFTSFMGRGARMPRHVAVIVLAVMWVSVASSVWSLYATLEGRAGLLAAAAVVGLAGIGTWCILRLALRPAGD